MNTQKALVTTVCDFFTVAIHTLLHARSLYPPATFITARKYNFPVRQNRHPAVCAWINNTVSHVQNLLEENAVSRVAFVVFTAGGEIWERYLFDVERLPVVERAEMYIEFEGTGRERNDEDDEEKQEEDYHGEEDDEEGGGGDEEQLGWNMVDVEEQLRATISKLDYEAGRKGVLPHGCTYTVAVELRDDRNVLPPIGHPQPWIPSVPSLQTKPKSQTNAKSQTKVSGKTRNQTPGSDVGGAKTTPVRLVSSGEFILETWIEEGRAKFASQVASAPPPPPPPAAAPAAASAVKG